MSEFVPSASVDDEVTALSAARVPVLDRGFLYGDSVYEVFRTYGGVPLFLDEHWARMENSAALIGMDLGFSRDEVLARIREVVGASKAQDAGRDVYVRIIITRGEGPVDLLPGADLKNRLIVIVKGVPEWPAVHYSRGVRVAVVRTRRNPSTALDPNIKGGNYLNNVIGVIEADRRGAEDCLMLDDAGLVTEASNSNVFFVIDGELVTPSQVAANLKGLTKAAVHAACAEVGLETREVEIAGTDIAGASECFLTSATREVMPVVSVLLEDGSQCEFPPGGGDLTRRVKGLYSAYIERYIAAHESLSLFGA